MRVARVSDINRARASKDILELKAEIESIKLRLKTLEQNAGVIFTDVPTEYIGKTSKEEDSDSNE